MVDEAPEDAVEPAGSFDHEAALAGCARRDRWALKGIYDAEARQLLGVALRIVRRRDFAEEVVHDAFIRIWTRASTFDASRGSARGWIYMIVRHLAINKLREGARESPIDEEWLESQPGDAGADPYAALARRSNARALHRCLEALDEPKRRAIMLAFVDGFTHEEISRRLGAPLGTVKAWVRRGLLSLRECLS
jgi:RNA polymerase sigma-70 factor, ECF subfamily